MLVKNLFNMFTDETWICNVLFDNLESVLFTDCSLAAQLWVARQQLISISAWEAVGGSWATGPCSRLWMMNDVSSSWISHLHQCVMSGNVIDCVRTPLVDQMEPCLSRCGASSSAAYARSCCIVNPEADCLRLAPSCRYCCWKAGWQNHVRPYRHS